MKEGLRKSSSLVTALLLSLSLLVLPVFSSNSVTEASPAAQSVDRQVMASVRMTNQYRRELLVRPGINILAASTDEKLFILTTSLILDQLQIEGWEVQVLYETDENGKWKSAAPAGDCTYSIMPTSRAFADVGGVGSFDLSTESDCEWIAVSSQPWILIHGVPQGQGSVTISFTILQNDSPVRRTGIIFLAGQVFEIFQGAQFEDVIPGQNFYLEIGKISARGITAGCTPTNFCPNQATPRDQMAALILKALGDFNPPDPAMQRFADVPPTNLFYRFIDRLAELNITVGCGGGNYCPSQPVTRAEMAAFILRALGEFDPPEPAVQRFSDVPPTNPFYKFIDRLAVLGITQGCAPNLYCPADPVTRAQMAAFLVRAFSL